jgi:hypothetical protein
MHYISTQYKPSCSEFVGSITTIERFVESAGGKLKAAGHGRARPAASFRNIISRRWMMA